uniref:Putative secreted protein ovary overexpressed n=1 Tax=Rhipicephalus microplus TaxID=6941 RepID=A0A6M2DAF7_RHIMP
MVCFVTRKLNTCICFIVLMLQQHSVSNCCINSKSHHQILGALRLAGIANQRGDLATNDKTYVMLCTQLEMAQNDGSFRCSRLSLNET